MPPLLLPAEWHLQPTALATVNHRLFPIPPIVRLPLYNLPPDFRTVWARATIVKIGELDPSDMQSNSDEESDESDRMARDDQFVFDGKAIQKIETAANEVVFVYFKFDNLVFGETGRFMIEISLEICGGTAFAGELYGRASLRSGVIDAFKEDCLVPDLSEPLKTPEIGNEMC